MLHIIHFSVSNGLGLSLTDTLGMVFILYGLHFTLTFFVVYLQVLSLLVWCFLSLHWFPNGHTLFYQFLHGIGDVVAFHINTQYILSLPLGIGLVLQVLTLHILTNGCWYDIWTCGNLTRVTLRYYTTNTNEVSMRSIVTNYPSL